MNRTDPRVYPPRIQARDGNRGAAQIVARAAALALLACLPAKIAWCVEAAERPTHSPATIGSIEGTVRYLGAVPRADVPDNAGLRADILKVDRDNFGLRYAVVHLLNTHLEGSSTPHEFPDDGPPGTTVVDQRDLIFVPHLLAVRSGQRVAFSNSDSENHNVRAQAENPRNRFNILTGPGLDYERRFQSEPDNLPIRLSCDIHPWMYAWVYAFDHPFFSVTDEYGGFRIDRVPPGRYRIVVHQPDGRLTAEGAIVVAAGSPLRMDIEFSKRHLDGAQTLRIAREAPGSGEKGPGK